MVIQNIYQELLESKTSLYQMLLFLSRTATFEVRNSSLSYMISDQHAMNFKVYFPKKLHLILRLNLGVSGPKKLYLILRLNFGAVYFSKTKMLAFS